MNFEQADQCIHDAQTQWHFGILNPLGFVPDERYKKGLVRSYTYRHPDGHVITCTTGYSADYWTDESASGVYGYWRDLEPHVKTLLGQHRENVVA